MFCFLVERCHVPIDKVSNIGHPKSRYSLNNSQHLKSFTPGGIGRVDNIPSGENEKIWFILPCT